MVSFFSFNLFLFLFLKLTLDLNMFHVSTHDVDYNNRFHGCRISLFIFNFHWQGNRRCRHLSYCFVLSLKHFYFSLPVFAFGVDAHEKKNEGEKTFKKLMSIWRRHAVCCSLTIK